jgi:tetratricopeptide (TPR) repeat protein
MRTIFGYAATAAVSLITSCAIFGGDVAGWNFESTEGLRAFQQGRFNDAEKYTRKALETLGSSRSESPEAAICLHNLGSTYSAEGRYAEAAESYRQALRIWEKASGYEASTAIAQGNLGTALQLLGRYSEAEALELHSLETLKRLLGPEHPDTAAAYNNLGDIYTAQGRYAEAETSFRKAAAIREKILGRDHPDTALTWAALSVVYRREGKYADAIELLKRALVAAEAIDPWHSRVAVILNNLATTYLDQGNLKESGKLMTRAISIWTKTVGPDHPSLALGYLNIAAIYYARHKYKDAV